MNKDTGGPAFPRGVSRDELTETFANDQDGMTLRDYFAAKAMQALLSSPHFEAEEAGNVPKTAYAVADAMLEAREK